MIYLNKILPIFASPLFLLILLAAANVFFRRRWISFMIVVVIVVAANPILASRTGAYLEAGYSYVPVETVEPVDAVIVLSGMLTTIRDADGKIHHERDGSIDRLEAGLEFLQKGKADTLVLTRGFLPWSQGRPEGDVLKEIAVSRGIPAHKILLTEIAQNTDQEAAAIAKLLPKDHRLALVTSAFHMPRALKVFRARGLTIVPHAVDFNHTGSSFTIIDLLPSAGALAQNSRFVREMIGRLYYALKYGANSG